jgi:predicted Zn-dependent peptidase
VRGGHDALVGVHHDNQNFPSNIKETQIMILIKSHPKQINHQPKARPPINKKKSKFPKKIKKTTNPNHSPRLEILQLAIGLNTDEHESVAGA